MSQYEENVKAETMVAYADIEAYRFLNVVNDNGVAKVQHSSNGGDAVYVSAEKVPAGYPLRCIVIDGGGKFPIEFGGSITAAGEIQSGANGVGIAQTGTNKAFARALETGVSGDERTAILGRIHHQ